MFIFVICFDCFLKIHYYRVTAHTRTYILCRGYRLQTVQKEITEDSQQRVLSAHTSRSGNIWHIIQNVYDIKKPRGISQHLNNFLRCVFFPISVAFFQENQAWLNTPPNCYINTIRNDTFFVCIRNAKPDLQMGTQFFDTFPNRTVEDCLSV